jgi:hypothetical protein
MSKVYICGSFRFTREIQEVERRLKEENVKCEISKRMDSRGILGCLKKIDDTDVVYVVNPKGYIGKSVSFDRGYAYAKNKSVYAMYPIDDPPVTDLMSGVLSPKALVALLKESFRE